MNKLKVKLTKGKTLTFNLAEDGWWEAKGYAINPSKTKCVTDPWYADYICPAPEHGFKIINE